jgi:type IV pilus assembly protein PilW
MLRQKGLTLIELMIAMLLSILVTGMIISMFTSSIGGHAQAIRTMRLNQDMRIAMDMMVRDIRRAGYWSGTNVASNPHATALSGSLPIGIFDFGAGTDNCVLVSYDEDEDAVTTSEEFFGFRLNGTELESLATTSAAVSNPNCASVFNNNWQDLLDTNTVQVNGLTFTTYPASTAAFATSANKSVIIMLDASSLLDPNVRTVITEQVRVRNEF